MTIERIEKELRERHAKWIAQVAEWRAAAPSIWTDEFEKQLGPSLELRAADALGSIRSENERLREALGSISAFNSGDDTTLGALKQLALVRQIASRALTTPSNKEGGDHG